MRHSTLTPFEMIMERFQYNRIINCIGKLYCIIKIILMEGVINSLQ